MFDAPTTLLALPLWLLGILALVFGSFWLARQAAWLGERLMSWTVRRLDRPGGPARR